MAHSFEPTNLSNIKTAEVHIKGPSEVIYGAEMVVQFSLKLQVLLREIEFDGVFRGKLWALTAFR